MRLSRRTALIGSLASLAVPARAQSFLPSSQGTPTPPPSYTGPLDLTATPAVVAYGQRAMKTAQIGGNLYTLRRDSDNATLAFPSTASGGVDPAAVLAWAAGANVLGTVWNDSSGNGFDIAQSDTTRQPLWANNLINSRPGFTASDTFGGGLLVSPPSIPIASGKVTMFMVTGPDTEFFVTASPSTPYVDIYMGRSGVGTPADPYVDLFDGTNEAGGTYPQFTGVHQIAAAWQFGSAVFRLDGAAQTQNSSFDNGGAVGPITGLSNQAAIDQNTRVTPVVNDICLEFLLFDGILPDVDIAAISANQKAWYGTP